MDNYMDGNCGDFNFIHRDIGNNIQLKLSKLKRLTTSHHPRPPSRFRRPSVTRHSSLGVLYRSLKEFACNIFSLLKDVEMNRNQLIAEIESGHPFTIRMADGKEYDVPHRDYISLSPVGTFATVYDDEGRYFVLPLITMTGIASTVSTDNAGT